MSKLIQLALLSLLLLNCQQKPHENKNTKARTGVDVVTIHIPKKTEREKRLELPSNFFYDVTYIPLETDSVCLVGPEPKWHFYKDNIIVMDELTLNTPLRFNMDGKYINSIGSIGNGPGEYSFLVASSINNGYLHGIKNAYNNFIKYNIKGEYISTSEIPSFIKTFRPTYMANTGEAYYFSRTTSLPRKSSGTQYELLKYYNNKSDQYFVIPKELYGKHFGHVFSFSGEKVFYNPAANDSIYELKDTEVIARYCHRFSDDKYKMDEVGIQILKALFFYETELHCYFQYFFNNKASLYYYDRSNERLLCGSEFDYTYDNSEMILPGIVVGCSNEHFISYLYPFQILEQYEKLLASNKKIHPKISNLVSNLKEDDNPVIVKYRVRF
ncbi:MAG: 6-bladed beta-propeller [Bacteroidales bacterium]